MHLKGYFLTQEGRQTSDEVVKAHCGSATVVVESLSAFIIEVIWDLVLIFNCVEDKDLLAQVTLH